MLFHFFGHTNVFVRPGVVISISLLKNSMMQKITSLFLPPWYDIVHVSAWIFSSTEFFPLHILYQKTYWCRDKIPNLSYLLWADAASSKFNPFRIVKNIPGWIYSASLERGWSFVFLLSNAGNRKGKQPVLLEAVLCLLQNQAKLPVWYFPGSSGRWNHVEIKRSLKV